MNDTENDTENWRDRAVCARVDAELFFPVGRNIPDAKTAYRRQVDEARRVCQTCPSKDPCLREAVEQGYDFGVWGGTSEEFRRWLRKPPPKRTPSIRKEPRDRAQCGTEAGRATHIRKGERPCDDCRIAANRARARRAAAS